MRAAARPLCLKASSSASASAHRRHFEAQAAHHLGERLEAESGGDGAEAARLREELLRRHGELEAAGAAGAGAAQRAGARAAAGRAARVLQLEGRRAPVGVLDEPLLEPRAVEGRGAPSTKVVGRVLSDCCRWHEFEIVKCEDSTDRTTLTANVVHTGYIREMGGLNRAKHAVLEATILATRLHLILEMSVREQLAALSIPVEKTAGSKERQAFSLVTEYVETWYRNHDSKPQ